MLHSIMISGRMEAALQCRSLSPALNTQHLQHCSPEQNKTLIWEQSARFHSLL